MSDLPERSPQGASERWIVAFFALGFFGLVAVSLFEHYQPQKLGVIFFLLFWIPLLVIHEAGHAVVARLCGWQVDRVVLGFGRTWWTRRVGGVPVEVKTIPLSGYVLPRPLDLRSPQLKNALIFAGGPVFELIAALAVIIVTGPAAMFSMSQEIPVIAAQSFCIAAALGLLFTLVPHTVSTERGESWSDGLGILMSFRLPDAYFAELIREPEDAEG